MALRLWASSDLSYMLFSRQKIFDATHESIIRSQRPWVSKDGLAELTIKIMPDSMVGGEIAAPIKNFGPSPALSVGFGAYPFIRTKGDDSEFLKAREEACRWADTNVRVVGDSLFPQQTKKLYAPILSQVSGVEKVPMILVAACIAYRDQFDTTQTTHHTTFCVFGQIAHLESLASCGIEEIAN